MAKKEPTPEIRVVMAFAVSLFIIFALQPLLVRKSPPAATEQKPAVTAPAQSSTTSTEEKTEASPTPPAQEAKSAASAQSAGEATAEVAKRGEREEEITVVGDVYRVVFSTRGAVVKSWQLTKFKDAKRGPLELINTEAAREHGHPLMLWAGDQPLRDKANNALFIPSATGELRAPVTLTFEYSEGGLTLRKQLSFKPDHYDVSVTSKVSLDGKPVNHQLAWRGSFGDTHDAAVRGTLAGVFIREPENMTRLMPDNLLQDGFWKRMGSSIGSTLGFSDPVPAVTEVTREGQYQFAGVEDHFFTAAALPDGKPLKVTAFSHQLAPPEGQSRPQTTAGIAVGSPGDGPTQLRFFVGPKDSAVLEATQPELGELVDLGWFAIIATPLYRSLKWIHDNIVANYGWAIILLTLVINLLLLPLKISSFRSARKMQAIAPQLRAIQDKYKGLKATDPKRQQMSQETMQLYQKNGVNPVGGCLPMLVQLPFLVGFYNVLNSSIEMRQAEWIAPWITDLSTPEQLPIRILPLLMCGTQFAMQRMTPMPGVDPVQQKIMLMMPVMFLFMFWGMSSGLVLYWTVGNVVGIAQQWYFNRTHQLKEVEAKLAKKASKKAK